ncbi:MarR family winged helix-turn-helix transcriptional regulator [Paenibacillus sp. WLX1005]|uniref:MarR family winged helix-turn-helix transcriptional regulator n=1 Tax=Paenibacillus sp. WLX1005 TaxID=3243766 RepID=UPI003984257B
MYRVNNAINTTFDAYISISQSRFEILALLCQENEISQGDLQKKVTLDKAAVARHLKQLEASKLVTRRKKEGDNRITLVQLTDQGKQLIETSQQEKEQFAKDLLHGISAEEFDTLQTILAQLNTNIDQLHGKGERK